MDFCEGLNLGLHHFIGIITHMKVNIPKIVVKTLKTIEASGKLAFVVGGSVRDMLIGKIVKDWDFTTNATPEEIQSLFPESFYDNKFGTVGITVEELLKQFNLTETEEVIDDLSLSDVFEITTFRTEAEYSDNRRPDSVSWGKTLEEDLQRRDYTINALALKLNGEDNEYDLIDLYQGKRDLDYKIIRAVGDPDKRFQEDALRLLRAIRMAAQLGFTIEKETLAAISRNAYRLQSISHERVRDEFLKILASPFPKDGIKMLLSTGLLQYILPEIVPTLGVEQAGHHTKDVYNHSMDALEACPSPDPIVRLATLLHDVGKPAAQRIENGKITFYGHEVVGARIAKKIAERLHLSNRDSQRLYTLVRYHMFAYQPEMTDAAIRRFIKKVGLENINDMMMLRVADRVGGGSKQTSWRLRELQKRIGEVLYTPMQIKDLKVNGNDVMEIFQVKGGPIVGQILKALFDEVMEDSSKNDREYLLGRIKEFKDK
jgi:tRNA nucleotidyltransferase (CCA-adding enzyme)